MIFPYGMQLFYRTEAQSGRERRELEAMMNKLVKDFAKLLEERGLVIEDEDKVSQVPNADYTFAKQIYKSRELLVPLMLKLAICANEKETALYNISYKGGMLIVRQFLQNIVDQFLDNLRKSELVSRWCRKDDCQYEISLPQEETKLRFFRSTWAEQAFRYVIMKTVHEFCNSNKISCRAFQNVNLRRKDETNLFTELDLVVQIEKRFYVFEIKSGPWINIIQWAKREMALVQNDDCVRNIVCTIYDSIPEKIFEPQLLLKLNNIESKLTELLKLDFESRKS